MAAARVTQVEINEATEHRIDWSTSMKIQVYTASSLDGFIATKDKFFA